MIRNRQLEILLYLLKVKKSTHRELANQFEVSVKTIQRDIDQLSIMGIPVTCKQGNQGGIYIDEQYKLSRSLLSDADLQSIIFALSLYDSISAKKHKESVLKKLVLLSPDLIYLLENDANEYFVVDMPFDKINMKEERYAKINACLDEEYYLQIDHLGKQKTIAPISYVLRPDGLYLYAFSTTYELIKTDEIENAVVTNLPFERNFIPYKENKTIAFK
ncbi:helix-turn-helix transcriptional regulator [Virgibacillus sp. MG-45]|uniref:helix-turn-helix transcriptional regulator n=1 Tax=Virgibacillus sp. MG-45 TaxID=3102791 RepID=UPI002EDA9623